IINIFVKDGNLNDDVRIYADKHTTYPKSLSSSKINGLDQKRIQYGGKQRTCLN
ncbi:hypothetical protein K1T71_001006, partial [Dendrolimus kikuchii]